MWTWTLLRPARLGLLIIALFGVSLSMPACAGSKNGFDLSESIIPEEEILSGGPPRDGIPALNDPVFISAAEADFLDPQSRVMGISRNGISKAYPIAIMNWHEIVNDVFADEGIVVTFCPLCGTGMAFKADIEGKQRDFGVSGLLYNSDVLLYDRDSDTLWSQIARQAVSGPLTGKRLEMVAVSHTSWADWSQRYPDTLVLSTETGHFRDYSRDPYAGYESSPMVMFPVANRNERFHPKEQVIGLEIDKTFKAYPFVELDKASGRIEDTVGGESIIIEYSSEHRSGRSVRSKR